MKAVVAAFNQEKALVGAFSVITNLRMDLLEALDSTDRVVGQHGGQGVRLGLDEEVRLDQQLVHGVGQAGTGQQALLPSQLILSSRVDQQVSKKISISRHNQQSRLIEQTKMKRY